MKRCVTDFVLPFVFDDSLSYLETLMKIGNIVNQLCSVVNNNFTAEITDYINNNFNSLMFNAIYDEQTESIIIRNEVSV